MSNKDGNLVIFEHTTFRNLIHNWVKKVEEHLANYPYACAKEAEGIHHFTNWVSVMNRGLLNYGADERNLPQLLETIEDESRRYNIAIDTFEKISQDSAERREDIAFLTQQLRRGHVGLPEFLEAPSNSKNMSEIDQEWKWLQSMVLDEDPKPEGVEQSLGNLQQLFGEELDYIAKNKDTHSIFEIVEHIGDGLIIDIQKKIEPILGTKAADQVRENLNRDIKEFVYNSQSNISEQLTTVFESLQKIFADRVVSEVRAELVRVSIPVRLLDGIETHLSAFSTEIDLQKAKIDRFLETVHEFRDAVEPSFENFRRDFECQACLNECEHTLETDELEVLQRLFGMKGTDVFTRVGFESFESKDLKKVSVHVWERIDTVYDWQNRHNELTDIFRHARERLEDIYTYLEVELDG